MDTLEGCVEYEVDRETRVVAVRTAADFRSGQFFPFFTHEHEHGRRIKQGQ